MEAECVHGHPTPVGRYCQHDSCRHGWPADWVWRRYHGPCTACVTEETARLKALARQYNLPWPEIEETP